jgi:hypothetical protein
MPVHRVEFRSSSTERQPEIVRPQQHAGHGFPERQVQKPDREKPRGDPEKSADTVLLDAYPLHRTTSIAFVRNRGASGCQVFGWSAGNEDATPVRTNAHRHVTFLVYRWQEARSASVARCDWPIVGKHDWHAIGACVCTWHHTRPAMTNSTENPPLEEPLAELERQLISAFVAGAGQDLEALLARNDEAARRLLADASRHASDKLSEIEARSHFLRRLRGERMAGERY